MNRDERGSISVILAILFGLLLFVVSAFSIWAYTERQSYKNDVDAKIEAANKVAVQAAETAKDAEFVEKEKLPTRKFTGTATYGSLSFDYPKTWSVYQQEDTKGTVVDVYAHPGYVPGIKSEQPYALRAEITSDSYEKELAEYDKDIEKGIITATAYRPANVEGVLGVKLEGEIEKEQQGVLILMPNRDRTIKIYSESRQFLNDFYGIILPSLTFVP